VRRVGLVLAAFLVLLAAAPAQGGTPLVRHAVPGVGFSVGVPRGWRSIDYRQVATSDLLDRLSRENPQLAPLLQALRSPSSGVKLFAFDPQLTGGFATNMNLVVEQVPAGMSASQYAGAAVAQLGRLSNVVRPIRRRAIRLAAEPAVELSYHIRFTLSGKQVVTSTTQYVLTHDARAFVVTYTTLPGLAGRYASPFAASAGSIRLG
jgi:hypothetical protein